MFNEIIWFQSPVSVLLVAGFCFIIICKYQRLYNIPPGPWALPIFGSVTFFRDFKRRRHLILFEVSEKYGNIFSVYAGTQLVVFLNGYEVIREAFVNKAAIFSDRPNWLPSLQYGLIEGKGLVWQGALQAGPARKFAHQALREFGLGRKCLLDKVLQETSCILDVLKVNIGQPLDLKPVLKKAVTNVIHDVVFGRRFDLDDQELSGLILVIDDFFKGGIFIPKNFLPSIFRYFLPKDEKEYRRKQTIINHLKNYIYGSILEHERDFDSNNIRDFIDIYVNASKQQENEVSKGEVFRIILDLFLAGSETVANTLDWCFMFMVKYPDVQENCFLEIKTFQKLHPGIGQIEWAHRNHLPYIEATIAEIQRLAVIVPLGLPHVTSEDTILQGYTIPKNTIVFGNLYSCSMDSNTWSNVNDFKPERHLDEKGLFKRNDKLIPFSIGPRMCLGDSMAKLEIFLMFANIIRRFKFTKHGDGNLSVTNVKKNRPISSAGNFQVMIEERSDDIEELNNYTD